jgi:hypothetical protein
MATLGLAQRGYMDSLLYIILPLCVVIRMAHALMFKLNVVNRVHETCACLCTAALADMLDNMQRCQSHTSQNISSIIT